MILAPTSYCTGVIGKPRASGDDPGAAEFDVAAAW